MKNVGTRELIAEASGDPPASLDRALRSRMGRVVDCR
jgi:hypothetical protein